MSKHVRGICMSDMGPSLVAVGYEKTDGRKPLYTTDHADELAKALEAFAKYACDDETDPSHCYNCKARAVLTNYREATK